MYLSTKTFYLEYGANKSSFNSWVFNTGLPANEAAGHTDFDPTQSTTFKAKKGSTFSVSYGDNSGAAGTVGTDTVNIGGATVTSQAVELATAVSQEFIQDTASNGLVGLAFSSLNTIKPAKQKTFFDNISPTLQEPVLTANLKHATPGAYEFGRIDSTQFSGALQWTAVDESSGFWQFPSSTFAVGNGSVQQNTQNSPAIADTGTSLLLVDQSVVNGYYSQVKGAVMSTQEGGVIFPCSSFLPDLKVAMGPDYMATISGDLLTFSQIGSATTNGNAKRGMKRAADTQCKLNISSNSILSLNRQDTCTKGSIDCFGALQSSAGNNIQIMGDVMFKSQFVAFNNGNNSVGFAPHAN